MKFYIGLVVVLVILLAIQKPITLAAAVAAVAVLYFSTAKECLVAVRDRRARESTTPGMTFSVYGTVILLALVGVFLVALAIGIGFGYVPYTN